MILPVLMLSILVSIGLAVSSNQVVMSNLLGSLGILKLGLGLSQTKLVLLDGLLGLSIGSISMLKSSLQVHDISLQLLLHAVSLSLSLGFHLNSSLHALNGLVHVLPGGIKLLILLSHSALNLLPDLGELKLGTEHLVLLLLKSTLSFRESSFKLHLLSLKTLADFVNLMDGAATLADLVHDVLDLIGEALVLSPDFLKLEDTLLIGRLDSEEFRGGIAGFLLAAIKVHAKTVNLGLPFSNNPVKLLGLLLHGGVEDLGLIKLNTHAIKHTLQLSLGLLNLGQLGVELSNSGLSLREAGLHLQSGHLKLFSLANTILLIPGPPHIRLTLSLVQLSHQVLLGRNIFLQESSLGLHLFIIGTIFFIGKSLKLAQLLFRVGHTNKRPGLLDDDKPSLFSHGDILSELPLADNNELSLSTLLLIDNISHSLEDLTLHVTNKLQDNVISGLLKHSKSTSTEEDKSVTKTISFPGEVDLVHQSVGSSLVVTRASNFSSSKDSISQLVVRVEHSVGESSHTDSDALKRTITSELVHDKRRLNLSRLLVSVGHKATHKVRLTAVQSGHELTKRDQVDGGDSLTAATLLLLTLFLGGSSRLSRMISPQ